MMRIVLLGALLAFTAHAADIVVSPGEGALGKAIASANDGDTIRVSKGTYREYLTINKRISLVGEKGAVIDPSEPLKVEWKPADAVGPGVWQASLKNKPHTLLLDGKIIAEIDYRRATDEGAWHWKKLLASGPPRSGYKFILGLWMYQPKESLAYLRLPEGADPNKAALTMVPQADAVIRVRGAKGASISGLTIANGYRGIALTDGAQDCVVRDCVIGPWDKMGVFITGGATRCLVEKNEIFRGSLEDWTPVDTSKERYEIWQIHKDVGYYDCVGVGVIRAGADNRVHANHIYLTFDGVDVGDSEVESLDKPLVHPEDGKGTWIWENLIENTRDSGIELGVGCIDVQVHHNILRQTHGGLRYKLPRIGPVFIYRNVLEGGAPMNIWYSMDDSPAEGYVYHNTIVGGSSGLMYSIAKPRDVGTPRWHYLNNLVVNTKSGFYYDRTKNGLRNFTADYNVVTGGGKPWPNDTTKDTHSRYVDKIELTKEFFPAPDSPAIDAGLDLSTYFHGKPLPGCEPGYFKGKAPDAGAFEVK